MRYSRIERYGKDYSQGTAFASNALYNSQPHVSLQANDKGRSNPFINKKKELKAGPDGIKYYNITKTDLIILVPETHPLFNYPLLVHGGGVYKRSDASQDVKFHLVDMLKNFAKQIVA